ncbi:MAG: hypothetical protein JW726_16735, partial [Anaerolineales bacterium]|nr:hypothetical protein [Anaerolineales bacterium]
QQYALDKYENGTWTTLIERTFNAAINDETGVNRLRVERDGEQIRLYVNGVLLDSISDSSYLIDQEASLCSISGAEANVAARFDNFTYSQLP